MSVSLNKPWDRFSPGAALREARGRLAELDAAITRWDEAGMRAAALATVLASVRAVNLAGLYLAARRGIGVRGARFLLRDRRAPLARGYEEVQVPGNGFLFRTAYFAVCEAGIAVDGVLRPRRFRDRIGGELTV
jgi:hypothetical protein